MLVEDEEDQRGSEEVAGHAEGVWPEAREVGRGCGILGVDNGSE
jgi:hypothetical protein